MFVNDEKVCRAGVGPDGVLNAIVNWVNLTGAAARNARRLKQPAEEMRLHVGGLSGKTHQRWQERMLNVGDRITVAIASAKTADAPLAKEPQNPKLREEQEQRYYLRLKKKFEKAPVASRAVRRDQADRETRFLNVDLDIWSGAPLDDLVAGFGRNVCVLHVGKEGRRYGAHLELAISPRDPDRLIRRFVALVQSLPRSKRALWNRARVREFNVGIQAGRKPHGYELRLQPKTLQAVSSIHARLGFTVYSAVVSRVHEFKAPN